MKQCTCCREIKEHTYFSPDKRLKSGLQSKCKLCFAAYVSEARKKDPTKHREAVKKHVQKNYEKKLKDNSEYRRNNPDKVSKWKKKDREVNKVRIAANNAKRRAMLSSTITPELLQMYALRDFYTAMSLGESFHVDHIKPLSKGGTHTADNLQVIPAIDNLRKGSRYELIS